MRIVRNTIFLGFIWAFFACSFFALNVPLVQAQTCEDDVATLYGACTDQCVTKRTTAIANCGSNQSCIDDVNNILYPSCISQCDGARATALANCAGSAASGSLGEQYQDIRDQGLIFAGICQSRTAPCDCRDEGRCTLEDLLQVVVNISVLILGISGSVTLLILFYGGILWITAHGNPTMVENGKKAIIGAAIGLGIIFGAYAAVTLLVKVLTQGEVTAPGENLEDIVEEAVPGSGGVIETGNQ